MAAPGSASEQPQFLVRAGDENFSHAPLIENPENDQIIVPDVSLLVFIFFKNFFYVLMVNPCEFSNDTIISH